MKQLILGTLLMMMFAPLANAHHNKSYYKARVIEVTPVYEYVTVHNDRHYDRHQRRDYYQPRRSNHLTVLGSVIGGSIGHATSDRKHKVIGTLAGAVIGGAIAHNIEHKPYRKNTHARQRVKKQRVLRGYDVIYKMKGRLYQTFSRDLPKKYIRIYR